MRARSSAHSNGGKYERGIFSPGVQRRQRRVLDTSSTYVRGEENLHGWRPRGDSLIFDHQWELEKLTRLEEVERVRHTLLLRERLGLDRSSNRNYLEYTKSEKEVCNMVAKNNNINANVTNESTCEYTEREKDLMNKCIRLIQGKGKESGAIGKGGEPASPSEEVTDMSTSIISSIVSGSSMELCSPERAALPGECAPFPPAPSSPPGGPRDPELVLYVPDMEEIPISPVVARKGYLNVLEHKTHGWKKRWVVSSRAISATMSKNRPLVVAGRTKTLRLHLPRRQGHGGKGPDQPEHRSSGVLRGPARHGQVAQHVQRRQQAQGLPPADAARERGPRLAVRHQSPPRGADPFQVGAEEPRERSEAGG